MAFLLPACSPATCWEFKLCHVAVAGTLELVRASGIILPVHIVWNMFLREQEIGSFNIWCIAGVIPHLKILVFQNFFVMKNPLVSRDFLLAGRADVRDGADSLLSFGTSEEQAAGRLLCCTVLVEG